MKKDINFIKFIKPKLKEREIKDKAAHREAGYRMAGVQTPSLDVEDIGLIASVIRKIRREKERGKENESL